MDDASIISCPTELGTIFLVFFDKELVHIFLPLSSFSSPHDVKTWLKAQYKENLSFCSPPPCAHKAAMQLADYFAGKRQKLNIPWSRRIGTPFECKVWEAICKIPYGHTLTCEELATRIKSRNVAAVARAVYANPLPIVIPSHRVTSPAHDTDGFNALQEYLLLLEATSFHQQTPAATTLKKYGFARHLPLFVAG